MATADQLLERIFSWIEQRERCAEKLRKLARELESLREKCNGSECIGSSVSVAGAACLIGAGVATLFTGGAAAPFLGLLGGVYTGVGLTVSLATKLTEHLISSDTMKDAQEIEQKSNDIGKTIQRLLKKLKAEKKGVNSFADPDELDRHVMTEILGAMARRSGLKWPINISSFGDGWGGARGFTGLDSPQLNPNLIKPEVMTAVAGVLICFSFQAEGKASKLLFAKGAEQLIKTVSSAGFKTFLKGGGMAVGGAVGLAFALSEAIDNWKDMIEKNHVTEASQSLRDTADAILEMTRTLRKQLDDMKRMLEEMEKQQREQEEQLRREFARKQEEEQLRREVARRQQEEQRRREVARRQQEEQHRREVARRQQEEQLRREVARRQQEEQRRREVARRQQEEQHRREVARRQQEEQHRREVARRQQEEQLRREIARKQEEEKLLRKIARRQQEEQLCREIARKQEEEKLRREIARRQQEEQLCREIARKQEEEKLRREVTRKQEEEKLRREVARKQEEEKLRREVARKQKEEQLRRYAAVISYSLSREMNKKRDSGDEERDHEEDESDRGDEERDREEEESDRGDEERDREEEESDRGDEERDREEEENDRGDEESDSEEETEEEENKQSGGKQKKKLVVLIKTRKSDSNEENNHKFETNPSPPGSIRMGLLNVQSLTAKTEEIKELITQNSLDVFLPTETWLKRKGGDHVLGAASPENFSSFHQVRPTRDTFNVNQVRKSRGGGVAIQYSQVLQGEKIKLTKKAPETFEYVAAELQHCEWGQPVLLINVYRPPGNLNSLTQFYRFLEEFQSLLDEASARYNSIIITGDFNIHVENEMMSSTTEFRQLLEWYNLVQHVEEPTHRSDHFLDLVITRNVEISDLTVQDDGISDHYTVIFNAEPVSEETDDEESTKRYKRKEE
ncbi:uncharacterized protein [Thunnus thynnus]|uniref:uncharacterized protein isoform X1 n=1 Tax=Thunnus thynnus TaxID=8237 RepID=UPI003527F52D